MGAFDLTNPPNRTQSGADGLLTLARKNKLVAGHLTGIGAVSDAVIGVRDGSARGGHLVAATVQPTSELVLTNTPSRAGVKSTSNEICQ
jgi:predicted DNA-binding protein with PD1-like motif